MRFDLSHNASPTVITVAFPFVPAKLSVAHIASTYLPADVTRRFWKVLGRTVPMICATDVHSIQVSRDGRTRAGADEMCLEVDRTYRSQLAAFGIECDVWERTDHPAHVARVRSTLLRLHDRGLLEQREVSSLQCSACQACPPPRLARREDGSDACPYCGSRLLSLMASVHWLVPLDAHRPRVKQFAEMLEQPDVRAWALATLDGSLPAWDITRDNQVGLPIPLGDTDQSLYLWFESLVGYCSFAAMISDPPYHFAHFIGKNITYHHCVIWPVLFEHGCDVTGTIQVSARGFLDFNRSTPGLLDIAEVLAAVPRDYLRFMLALKTPDRQVDFAVTSDLLRETTQLLRNKIGNLLRRMAVHLHRHDGLGRELEAAEPVVAHFVTETVPRIAAAVQARCPRRATEEVVRYALFLNRELDSRGLFRVASPEGNGTLVFALASLLTVLAPIVPSLAAEYGVLEGWQPGSLADMEVALSRRVVGDGMIWGALSA